MKRYLPHLAFVGLLLFTAIAWAVVATPTPQLVLPCHVVEVYDGDTLTADVTLRMRVRLIDCWAPEVRGKQKVEGFKSKAKLQAMVEGKDGMLTIPLHDMLGDSTSLSRVLGRLSVNGKDVSEEMVRIGAATKTKTERN